MDQGAHFFRCDFQVHSPRDGRWKGPKSTTAEDRAKYAAALIAACRQSQLHAIAMTDHHDMAFVGYVRRAAEEETDDDGIPLPAERRIIVFPGMELTLGVPCQALLLFDADFPEDLFSLAMIALGLEPPTSDKAKQQPPQRLNSIQSLKGLKEKIDEHNFLRGRYTVFPNVSDNESSLLRKGLAGKYIEMPWVGGYVDGLVSGLGEGN
jgi:chromosome segregation protein